MHLDISAVKEPGAYTGYIRKKILFLGACMGALVLLAFVSVGVGSVMIPFADVIQTLVYHSSGNAEMIVWNIRLPRVLAAVVCGTGLAAAGVVMQSVLRNPLSSPYTLGVSQAAAFGAAVAITLFGAGTLGRLVSDAIVVNNPYLVTICAFIASLIATSAILLVAKYRSTSPEVMILVGVALAALFTAGTTFLQYFSSAEQIAAIVFWTFGDVGRATWTDLAIMVAVITPCLIYFIIKRWDYNALDSGDETAKSLGVNAERVRTVAMFLSSLIAAVVVSFLGIIGFIGLVSPHMVRRIIGDDQRYLLPGSCIVGGIILLGADTVARIIIAPAVLPAGVLTAFLGAPLFLYLLIRGNRS
ncbi:MAG: iron ABC transporter permease [Methanomicrobiales archaeon HGW-Methanomicrobiales-1]|jgi:iron complex transport system permease protein|nr:MAG: iron ABC transporter permease [Methanomicrobiales archaeon HGW-Methanomicrobiales-1]